VIFTFCGDYPVVVDRWQTRAAACGQRSICQPQLTAPDRLLPERARFLDDDVEEAWRISPRRYLTISRVQSCVENLAPIHKLSLPGGVPR